MGAEELALLGRLDATIARAAARPTASRPSASASIHADIRLANLLVDDGHVRVIDFDDSGFALVHVRLRDHGLVHGGPPARARAARRVARGLPLGRAARPPPTRPSSTPS